MCISNMKVAHYLKGDIRNSDCFLARICGIGSKAAEPSEPPVRTQAIRANGDKLAPSIVAFWHANTVAETEMTDISDKLQHVSDPECSSEEQMVARTRFSRVSEITSIPASQETGTCCKEV